MADWTIYYNPKCGTSQKTLELLQSRQIQARVIEYLKTPITQSEIEAVLEKLGDRFLEAIRTKEDEYQRYAANPPKTKTALAAAIVKDPILLQRPIVVTGNRAVVARPPEKVLELF